MHIDSGTESKDFKNLMLRFKYTPGDPLDQVGSEETPKRGVRKSTKSVIAQAVEKLGSQTGSETLAGDTPETAEEVTPKENKEGQNKDKVGANAFVSMNVNVNDKEVIAMSEQKADGSVEVADQQLEHESVRENRPITVGPPEVHVENRVMGNDVREVAELEAKGVLEQKGEVVMDLTGSVKGDSAIKGQNAVKETIKLEQSAIIPMVFRVEDELSEEESSEGDDVEDGSGVSDEAESDDDSEDDSEDSSDTDTNSDDADENARELRKRLKRYGGLPVIPKKSSKLEAAVKSRLVQKELKEVEAIDVKAKKDQSSIAQGIINIAASMKQEARRYSELGPAGRGAHVLAELKKLNQAYKEIIVSAVKGKRDNEIMMVKVEEERTTASENDKIYELAMQDKRESSTALSNGQKALIAISSTLLAQTSKSGEGKSGKSKKRKVDRDMPLFRTKSKKAKGGK